jgi:hypothetical protein
MEDLGKILIYGLPAAVSGALAGQLAREAGLSLTVREAGSAPPAAGDFDLVILPEAEGSLAVPPGTPVLPVRLARPLRLGALLRQAQQILAEPALYLDDFRLGPYLFRPSERLLSRGAGEDIALTDKETAILVYLARQGGVPAGREALLRHVWRYQKGVDTHTLETHIYRLRQKIADPAENPALLVTDEAGYRLKL